jgi:murein DD-endopeptidase MepM/ murein hydrolase activator NlpD
MLPGGPGCGRSRALLARGAAVLAVSIASMGLAAVLPAHSGGDSLTSIQSRLHSARGKLERMAQREQVLTTDIAAITGRIRRLQREVGALRRRELAVEGTLAAKRAELARARDRYQREHARYVRLRRKLVRAQRVLAERMVEIYKSDQPDLVTVILEADGFRDLLERAEYLSRIGEQDSAIVARVRELKRRSAAKRRLLVELKRRAAAAVEAIEAKQRELERTRAAAEAREGELAGARRDKQGVLASTRESAASLRRHIAALEAASAQVTAQLQGAGPLPAGPIRRGSQGFIWPVNGPITSGYGMRWGRLHAGVDISAPAGTPIRAAGGGRVAMAGWMGGYGQYTCIQHGGGVATCYAHQSSIGVGVGASVSQGQVIGSVGCTGHCFGDHLHFEVRVNGSPVDPMGYL